MGFSVAPNPNCSHIASASFEVCGDLVVPVAGAEGKAPRRNLYTENCACDTCGDAEETWVCLVCAFAGCSRYKAGHMVDHVNDESNEHSKAVIAISLADLSAWCFACDDYITHPKLEPVFSEFHRDKFGSAPTGGLHCSAGGDAVVLTMEENTTEDPKPAPDPST